jgi:hypothetical protein
MYDFTILLANEADKSVVVAMMMAILEKYPGFFLLPFGILLLRWVLQEVSAMLAGPSPRETTYTPPDDDITPAPARTHPPRVIVIEKEKPAPTIPTCPYCGIKIPNAATPYCPSCGAPQ